MKFRSAFTLFELILAIALSATLLALIGTAINLYLLRMDAGRTRVEEAQLARSILSTIAADVRATTTYQTQDISAIAQLAASAATVRRRRNRSIRRVPGRSDSARRAAPARPTPREARWVRRLPRRLLSAAAKSSTTAIGPRSQRHARRIDSRRGPLAAARRVVAGRAAAARPQLGDGSATNVPRPSDVKTVRYFLREGTAIDPSDLAATSLAPDAQRRAGGLVRQTIDRAVRQMAEQAGNSQLLEFRPGAGGAGSRADSVPLLRRHGRGRGVEHAGAGRDADGDRSANLAGLQRRSTRRD